MKTTQKILVFLCSVGVHVYFGLRLYKLWSSVHRFFFDRKWKDVELPKFTVEEAADKMGSFVWKRDGLSELFDAVCSPQKVQAVGFDGTSPHGNDCDEEAIWLSNVIQPGGNVIGADFFTVMWYETQGKFGGHNVCLLRCTDGFRYMDYGMPSKLCKSMDEVAKLVIERYAGWDTTGHGSQPAVLLTWVLSGPDLKPLMMSKI